jgi:hypothetical protein
MTNVYKERLSCALFPITLLRDVTQWKEGKSGCEHGKGVPWLCHG